MATSDEIIANALALAGQGFRVFPLAPGSKKPSAGLAWKEAATVIPTEVEKLFRDHPGANIGIAAGNGLAVIDVDVKDGKEGAASLEYMQSLYDLPATFEVKTPSGGVHIYLKTEARLSNAVDLTDYPGIDVRSDGGYVVAPGSMVDGKIYTAVGDPAAVADMPDSLANELAQGNTTRTTKSVTPLVDLDQEKNILLAKEYLLHRAPEAIEGAGGDHATFSVAAACRDYGLSEGVALELLLEHWNEQKASPPWMPDELEAKVANAFQYATGAWGGQTAEAEFDALDIDVGEPPARKAKVEKAKKRGRLTAMWCGDALEIALKDSAPPLIDGLLDIGTFAVMFGPSNCGKTFAALDICAAIATGRPWAGRKVEKGTALYIFAEGGSRVVHRIAALQKTGKLTVGAPLARISSAANLYNGTEDADIIITEANRVSAEAQTPLRLIVIDTLARVMQGGDENSGKDMAAVVAAIDRIRDATGATVLLIHHTGKNEARGMRGHSALLAAIDTEIALVRPPGEKIGRLTTGKQRDLPSDVDFRYSLESVVLGETSAGERRTSCIFKPADDLAIEAIPLTPGAASYLATLREADSPLRVSEWDLAHRRRADAKWKQGNPAPKGCSTSTLKRLRFELKDGQHIHESERDVWEPFITD